MGSNIYERINHPINIVHSDSQCLGHFVTGRYVPSGGDHCRTVRQHARGHDTDSCEQESASSICFPDDYVQHHDVHEYYQQ